MSHELVTVEQTPPPGRRLEPSETPAKDYAHLLETLMDHIEEPMEEEQWEEHDRR